MKKLIAAIAALALAGTACATTINFGSGSAPPRHKVEKRVKKNVKHHHKAPYAKHQREEKHEKNRPGP